MRHELVLRGQSSGSRGVWSGQPELVLLPGVRKPGGRKMNPVQFENRHLIQAFSSQNTLSGTSADRETVQLGGFGIRLELYLIGHAYPVLLQRYCDGTGRLP